MKAPTSKFDEFIFTVLIFLTITVPIGILGWQTYGYLRKGEWVGLSVLDLLRWFDLKWAFAPKDWVGLHSLCGWVPLSLAIFLALLSMTMSIFRDLE